MKLPRKLLTMHYTARLILAGPIAALVATSLPSRAADQTWDGGSVMSGLWSTLANWVGDSAAPGDTSGTTSPDVASFNAFGVNTWGNAVGNPIGIDANRNIFGINFTGAAGNYFIGATDGGALKVSSGGSIQILNTLTATNAVETINTPLQIQETNGAYTFANNSANGSGTGAGRLNFGGSIAGGAAGNTLLTLTGSNTNANTISGAIANGAAASLSLVKSGAGMWMLSGTNTYSGGTTVTAGTLRLRSGSALGIGNVTAGASTVVNYAATADMPLDIGGALSLTGGAGTILGGAIGSTATSARIAVSGAASATSTVTVNVFGISGVTPSAGTNAYTLAHGGPGSSLNGAIYTLGRVFNNTNFTVGSPTATATDLTVPVTSATALTTAYWKGGLSGAPSAWAASNGSTQSNWVATSGGANKALIPGAGTDVIFSNSTVTTSPATTTLGADMTIRSLTQQDTVNAVGLNSDGFSLTITPSSPTAGITMVSGAGDLTINSSVVLGAAQTWANSASAYLTVNGSVANGANLLTLAGQFIEISGAIGGGTGGLATNTINLRLRGENTYTGATTINGGDVLLHLAGSIAASTSITLNRNAALSLGNFASNVGANRLGDSIPITSNGGTFIYNNSATSGAAYDEAVGALAVNNGQTDVILLTKMLGGSNTQKLTFSALGQANTGTVTFTAVNGGPNATSDIIQVAGATQTTAAQIIAPWLTTGTDIQNAGTLDYGVYDAAGRILSSGIATSPEATWAPATNVTLSGTTTLTATRTLNTLRLAGSSNTLALGANNLETLGILTNGFGSTIASTSGVLRQPDTAAANLYVTTGGISRLTISAPIEDHIGALTLVKSGVGTLSLSGSNTFTGGVVLNSGTLRLDSNTALGTGPLTIFGGSLETGTDFFNANANPVILNGDVAFGSSSRLNLGTGAISLGTIAGTTRTITVGSNSGTLTLDGVISNGATANAIAKAGNGALVLFGANTYTGGTTVYGGLIARGGSALGTGSVTVNANGILNYAATANVPLTIGGNLNVTGGTFTALGGSIGSTATGAQIAVAGAAAATGAVKINVVAVPGLTPLVGTNTYTLVHGGAGSNLSGAVYSMGLVVNNTNYTVSPPTATATDITVSVTGGVTPLTTAYWTGGLPGATTMWAASNGSTQSNWTATIGGASQPLVPGATTDVIFTTFNSTSSTLGADMSVRSITVRDANVVLANDVGHTVTITPTSATVGIIANGSGSLTIGSNIVLGAAQTWASNSSSSFAVSGNVDNGGNLLTVASNSSSDSIRGAIGGTGGLTKTGAGKIMLSGANTYSGVTTVNGGSLAIQYFGGQGSVSNSSAVVLNNNAVLTLTNFSSASFGTYNDRLGDGIPIISNGGIFDYHNDAFLGPVAYAETIGMVTLANGHTLLQLSSDMTAGSGSMQTLTLSGLSQANAATVSFSAANTGPNTTTNVIKLAGATQTAAWQIIGPWATTASGTSPTDYVVYDAAGRILPAGIAGSTEDTWMGGANVTLDAGTTLTATRTLNSLRSTAGNGTLALGPNNLETFGILNGGAFLTITSSSGIVRQPDIQPANLYVSGTVAISAPIQDHGGALTLVKAGGSSLNLSGLNTFTGGLVLNSGTLELNSNTALGTGPLAIFCGTLSTATRFANANANAVNIYGDFTMDTGSGPIDLGTGPVTLGTMGGTTVINLTSINGGMLILGGVISNGTTASALVKTGFGTLMLTGANTYSGGTTVSNGQSSSSGGALTVRHGGGVGTGSVTVNTNAVLNYAARADTPLAIGGTLTINGGLSSNGDISTGVGGSIGATATSAQIAVTGAATATNTVKVNVFAVPGVPPLAGTNPYTLVHGGLGSGLNAATYSLGLVLNNTDFTVGTPTATATDVSVSVTGGLTPLTTAYWKGGLTGANRVWAASNGSSQSNWVANSGGANQGLVPGATTDIIFSNSTVTASPVGSTLGADMTIRTLTQQSSSSNVSLGVDGFTLTITPASASTGITIASGAQSVTINPNVVLGAAQTWVNNASFGFSLTVTGNVSNGANLLTIGGTGNTTISGAIGGGTGGLTKTGTGTLTLAGANTYIGVTTVNDGAMTIGTSRTGSISGSTAIFLYPNASLTLSNGASEGGVNRLGDSALISSTSGTFNYSNTASSGVVYAETVGGLVLTNGQTNVGLSASMSGGNGNMQTLTLDGLSQANAATVSFSSPSDLNATTDLIQVLNATQTAAGQIIAPWATTGTNAGSPKDYAVYDAVGRILPAGIAASAENNWTVADNSYTLSGGATLSGTRTFNSLRSIGGTNTLALGANYLETFGILNGGSGALTISNTTGGLRQPGTSPANLYISGSNSISISAPIQDHTGALTLVKSGAATLALSGANTFTGGVVLNAGTLELGSNTALGSGPLTIFGGLISSLTSFVNANANTMEINGDFTFSGSNPVNLGTGAVSLGTLPGTTRTISGSGNVFTLGGVISNGTTANALAKAGTNTLVLSGANTYSGGTTVSGGTLIAGNARALGSGNVTVSANGVLTYAATADQPLAIGGALSISGGSLGWVIGASATSAKIAVSGAATATGAVKLNISAVPGVSLPGGANTYTLIQGGADSSLDAATYTLKVFNNTDYTIGPPTVTSTDIAVSVTGGLPSLTTAYWTGGVPGATTVWAVSNGSTQSNWVAASGGAPQGLVPGAGATVVFSNSTVTTSPASSTLGANMTIRSLTQQDTVNSVGLNADGFSLTVTPDSPTTGIAMTSGARALTINSSVVLGAAQTWTNNSTSGLLTVTGNVTNGANELTVNGAGNTTISGVIGAGAGGLSKAGSGTLTLSGANTYSGATMVTAGTLAEGPTGTIANTSNLTVNGATAIFSLGSNHSDTVGTVTLQGGGSITGSGTSALTASTGNTFEMQSGTVSAILAGSGIALNKTTGGTVTLSGANTYTGTTTVLAGTLAEGFAGSIANTSNLTVNGATAIFSLGVNHSDTVGTVTLQNGGSITGSGASALSASAGRTFEMQSGTVSAILAGSGIALNKTTAATVTLSGANTYTGATIVTAGTLAEGPIGSIANTSNLTVNGATAIFSLGSNHSDTVGTVTLQGGGSITGSGTSALTASTGNTFEMQSGTVSAILAGSGIALNKTTAGTVTLSGANTYTGTTTVNAGTLIFADDQTLTSLTIADGATVVLADSPPPAPAPLIGLESGVTISESDTVGLVSPAVPEPGTVGLVLAGAALLGLRRSTGAIR